MFFRSLFRIISSLPRLTSRSLNLSEINSPLLALPISLVAGLVLTLKLGLFWISALLIIPLLILLSLFGSKSRWIIYLSTIYLLLEFILSLLFRLSLKGVVIEGEGIFARGFIDTSSGYSFYLDNLIQVGFKLGDRLTFKARLIPLASRRLGIFELIHSINFKAVEIEAGSLRTGNLKDYLIKIWEQQDPLIASYLKPLLLAIKDWDSYRLVEKLKDIGCYHLLVISGLHINLLVSLLSSPMILIVKNLLKPRDSGFKLWIRLLATLTLTPYIYLVGYTPPILRAWSMLSLSLSIGIIKQVAVRRGWLFRLNLEPRWASFNLTLLLFLAYKPALIADTSTLLTFTASYIVNLLANISRQLNRPILTRLLSYLCLSIFSFLVDVIFSGSFKPTMLILGPLLSLLFKISFPLFFLLSASPFLLSTPIRLLDHMLTKLRSISFKVILPSSYRWSAISLIILLICFILSLLAVTTRSSPRSNRLGQEERLILG